MPRIIIEAAIDSADDAARAVQEGADRLEVCGELSVGGITPAPELLRACLALGVPCVAMARPRSGGFTYGAVQLVQLHTMVESIRTTTVTGVVFGILSPDRTIDADGIRAIVRMCGEKQTIFHRAFDEILYARKGLETLIACGVTRVLTTGQASTAAEGLKILKSLVEQAEGRIEILPAGTIRGDNVVELVERTGVTQVHARATQPGVIADIRAALGE